MKKGTTVATVIMGVGVALSVLVYGGAAGTGARRGPTVTRAADATVVPIGWRQEEETKAQKLAKALKACKKQKPESKRKSCEKKARKPTATNTPRRARKRKEQRKRKRSEKPRTGKSPGKDGLNLATGVKRDAGKSIFTSNCSKLSRAGRGRNQRRAEPAPDAEGTEHRRRDRTVGPARRRDAELRHVP